jgi:hypothetical protein
MTGLRTIWGVELGALPIDVRKEGAALIKHHVERGRSSTATAAWSLQDRGATSPTASPPTFSSPMIAEIEHHGRRYRVDLSEAHRPVDPAA